MLVLLIIYSTVEAAFWLFLVYAVVRAFKALIQMRFLALSIWGAIIAAPFVLFYERNAEADRLEAARALEVASFKRHAVPETYPRVLEVHGFIGYMEQLILLDVLKIDEIIMFGTFPQEGGRGQRLTLAVGCYGRGWRYLDELHRTVGTVRVSDSDRSCVLFKEEETNIRSNKMEAIQYLLGGNSTLRLPGKISSSSNYEIRIKKNDRNVLIDYWERPYITRPSRVGPHGHSSPKTPDWKEYPDPGRLDFLLRPFGVLNRYQNVTTPLPKR